MPVSSVYLCATQRVTRADPWGAHPDIAAHHLVADVIKYALLRLAGRVAHPAGQQCSEDTALPFVLPVAVHSCAVVAPTTMLSVAAPAAFEAAGAATGSWRFFEVRPRKLAWLAVDAGADGPGGAQPGAVSRLSFDVVFGPKPRLEVTYVRSYEGFTTATMRLSACPAGVGDVTLDGAWDRRVSVPDVTVVEHFPPSCVIAPGLTYTLSFEVAAASASRGGRFQLAGVTTC